MPSWLLAASMLSIGGCGGKVGSFDTPDNSSGTSKLARLFGLGKDQSAAAKPSGQIVCPEITIVEGTAAARFHSGSPASNSNLRVQYSLGDVARECSLRDDKIALKVGIAGKVLLGPAGSPGNFSVPVRITVIADSDQAPIAGKLYRAAATIPSGKTEASFTVISEPILLPFVREKSDEDYTIKVGIDTAGAGESPEAGSRR